MKHKNKTIRQDTVLTQAVKTGNIKVVSDALQAGAPINARNPDGSTALFWAARTGSYSIVTFLIEQGADVMARDLGGNTASSCAHKNNYPKITQLLALYSNGLTGDTPLMKAIEFNYREFIPSLLKQRPPIDTKNFEGNTALMVAAYHGHLDLVLLLLEHHAELAIQNIQGHTAIDLAEQQGHSEIAQWLSHYQAVHLGKQGGNTPLMRAAKWGYEDIIPFLIDKENHVEAKNQEGETALLLAAQYGYQKVVSCLLKARVALDEQNDQGYTALMLAAKNGHYNIVHFLLEGGADLNIANTQGETALTWAARGGYKELVSLLLIKGATIPTLSTPWKNNACSQLIARYQAIGIQVKAGETPLIRSIQKGYIDLTKLWIAKGADLNVRNDKNETPLMIAVQCGNLEITQALIEKGAQLNLLDNNQMTALNRARHLWFRKQEVNVLLKSGATLIPRSEEAMALKPRMLPLLKLCLEKGDTVGALQVLKTSLQTYSDAAFSQAAHRVLKKFFLEIPKPSFLRRCFNKLIAYFYPHALQLKVQAQRGALRSVKARLAYEILVSSLVLDAPVHERQNMIEDIVEKSESRGRAALRQKLYADYHLTPSPVLSPSYPSLKATEFFQERNNSPELSSKRLGMAL